MTDIYDKLPTRFIRWAMDNDMHITMHKDYLDLNTGMKSHLHLYYEDGKYIAKMRYGDTREIETFNDLWWAVRDCTHGRDFMSNSISKLYNYGFDDFEWEDFK